MSLRDLCDVAYVLKLERLCAAAATGDADSLDDLQAVFDTSLTAPVTDEGTDRSKALRAQLRQAGVEV